MAELIPNLPEEIALECLTRCHHTSFRVAARVCRRWRRLFHSREFYQQRKKSGLTQMTVFLVQSHPVQPGPDRTKDSRPAAFEITAFEPATGDWTRVEPVEKYPGGLPLFTRLIGSEGKLVLMGGWDPASYNPVEDVFVYEFTTREWRPGRKMPDKRSFFAAAAHGGRIFVAGGHDENKNALATAWVYEVGTDEWSELTAMSQERDECEGVVIGSELWVVSGYRTESQGVFEESADIYETESDRWRRVDDAWRVTRCPRASVGIGRDGLFSRAESNSGVRVGVCGVGMGEKTIVFGSEYEGGSNGFLVVEGQNGKFLRMEVPSEFSGFVHSGCCTEI